MLMAHSLQKRPLQAKLLSPKAPARRSAAERSEARREAVGFELQPEYPSMESSPPRCLHSKSFLSFSLHPATKFPEYPPWSGPTPKRAPPCRQAFQVAECRNSPYSI